jgi:death-on-curing protein
MLDENGFMLTCDEDPLFKFVLQVAQHRVTESFDDNVVDREVVAIAQWVWDNSRKFEKGERAIQFRKLRQILIRYECELEFPAGMGNRINIARRVERRRRLLGFLPRTRTSVVRTQIAYRNEGSDVQKDAVSKLRADLELDEQHGVDSASFYDGASTSVGDFIVQYRKTLKRLARL